MSFTIQLSKPFFTQGEILEGVCHVSLTQPIITSCHVSVSLKGKSRSKILRIVTERHSTGKYSHSKTIVTKLDGKVPLILENPVVLATFPNGLNVGEYSFPFQIRLPQLLPASANVNIHHSKSTYRSAVVYLLRGSIGDLSTQMHVVINPVVVPKPLSEHGEKSFLLGGSGKLKMTTGLAKNVFSLGETIPISIDIDNESKKDVDKVVVKLMRSMLIGEESFQFLEDEVCRMEYEGVKRKSEQDKVLNFVIPFNICPSTNGSLLTVEYHLDVECDVAFAFDLELKPQIEIVYQPPFQVNTLPFYEELPKKWKELYSDVKETGPSLIDKAISQGVDAVFDKIF